MFRRRRRPAAAAPDPGPPAGVILHYRGRAIGCSVLRDPGQDRRGRTAWVAVPAEPVTIAPGEEYEVTATVLPDGAELLADFTSPEPPGEDEWWLPAV